MTSNASPQEIRLKRLAPRGPTRLRGVVSRPGPCTKSAELCATLLQMTPLVSGNASEPRTLVMRPRSTVTIRLHVSGQSRVQTAGCSRVVIGVLLIGEATLTYT